MLKALAIFMALMIALLGLVLADSPDPPTPPAAPNVEPPSIAPPEPDFPKPPTPRVPGVDPPRFDPPNVGPPSISGPSFGGGGSRRARKSDDDPGVVRDLVRVHDHHWSIEFLWHSIWGPMAAAALGLGAIVVALRRRRLPRTSRWASAGTDALVVLVVAGLLIAQAITVPSNDGAPLIDGPVSREARTEVDGTRVITVTRHSHHIHRPIEASLPLLILGGGLGVLGGLLGRDAVTAYRSRPRPSFGNGPRPGPGVA